MANSQIEDRSPPTADTAQAAHSAATATLPSVRGKRHKRKLRHSPFFWAALAGLITIPLLRPLLRRVPDPPPVLFQLPSFSLTNQAGEPFGSAQLRGNVYLVTFFFTHCPSICPKLMQSMLALQQRFERFESDIKLLSISVDPEVDTPVVLQTYARKLGVDPARWSLLTGPEERVRSLITDGFKSHLGQKQTTPEGVVDIAHSGAIGLVDQNGGFRGFYSTDPKGLDEVFHRSLHVRHPE